VRFPGDRVAKFYFPVTHRKTTVEPVRDDEDRWYVIGLDEVLVDLEVYGCTIDFVRNIGLIPGESVNLETGAMDALLKRVKQSGLRWRYAAGGTVANTLANYTHLSGEPSVLLGAISDEISPSSPAFSYVAQTPKALSLNHLIGLKGNVGVAVTCFTPDGERSFGVAPGVSGDYSPEALPRDVVSGASVAVTTLYCVAFDDRPITQATYAFMKAAVGAGVPVAFGLGTSVLVSKMRERVVDILEAYVSIAAMNAAEACALTGENDALLAGRKILEWVDVAVITEGARGLTICGYTDDTVKRQTKEKIRTKSISEYNKYEFSRLLLKDDCDDPIKIFSHIHPYRGGPDRLASTSGAGDAALAAFLHDVSANLYHRQSVPDSRKHALGVPFLTYSSLRRNAQYGNRVAYEVLENRSPRLDGPVGEDEE
jgi:inosine kinase